MKTLDTMQEGESAKLVNFNHETISGSQMTELLELGFIPGISVHCVQKIPFLRKHIFLVGGVRVGLRSEDCQSIRIEDLNTLS